MNTRVLIFIFGIIFSSLSFAQQKVSKDFLKEQIIERMDRVPEFKVLKEIAKEMGIENVYLFGGSAAAWAHYNSITFSGALVST